MVYFMYTITLLQDRCVLKTANPDGSSTMTQEVLFQPGEAVEAPIDVVNPNRPPAHETSYYHENGGYLIKIYTVDIPPPAHI